MLQSSSIKDKRPFTSYAQCPGCAARIEYWRTSGMSECYPHFYCNTCSNILWRKRDYTILRDEKTDVRTAILQIVKTLPKCKCGGNFTLEAEPKCPFCGRELLGRQQISLELRAEEPHALLTEGAEMLTES